MVSSDNIRQLAYIIILLFNFCIISVSDGDEIEFPSSFNPVGSGARAIGAGGAFIGMVDDATAASWNPGGLIRLKKPEVSMVVSGFHRQEDFAIGTNDRTFGENGMFSGNINYLSASYPFEFLDRNMILSISYQYLYDFNREWIMQLSETAGPLSIDRDIDYVQSGGLSAVGVSYCTQIIPGFSFGFTLNFWNLARNEWEQRYRILGDGVLNHTPIREDYRKRESFGFSGFNANIGLLWRVHRKFSFGAVFKLPFTASIDHQTDIRATVDDSSASDIQNDIFIERADEELNMPMAYGIGFSYHFSDRLTLSADIYKTHWDDCKYKAKNGDETSPISGLKAEASEIEPTIQVRVGAEYRVARPDRRWVMPIRAGAFYDPMPTEGGLDEFFGFSFGFGWTLIDQFSVDIAYQYRFADNVGDAFFEGVDFSQDVREHMVYLSMIVYWSKMFPKTFD